MARFLRLIGGCDAEGKQVGVYFEGGGLIRLSAQTVDGNPVRTLKICQETGQRRRSYLKDKIVEADEFNKLAERWEGRQAPSSVHAVREALSYMGYEGYAACR